MPKPKLLFVVAEDWYFLSHRLAVARAAKDAGFEVAVASAPGKRRQDIEAEGFAFHPLRLERGSMNPLKEWAALRDLTRLFRRERPDIVHLVAIKPILYGASAARKARVPGVICAVAGVGYVFYPGGPGRALLRRMVERAYRRNIRGRQDVRVILQNPDDKDLFLSRGLVREDQVRMILGNGLDLDAFSPRPEPDAASPAVSPNENADAPVILMHSRMLWDKGAGELVRAAHLLKERGVAAKVLLAGNPDPSNPASVPAETLAQWNAEGPAAWIPNQADVPALLTSCHVACLPSYREGAPQSLMEAAACGRPIVTTDVPGCREIVRHGENGLLVPARDPEALARALETLVRDPELRRAMGKRGRELAEECFDRKVIAAQTLDLYRELLPGEKRP